MINCWRYKFVDFVFESKLVAKRLALNWRFSNKTLSQSALKIFAVKWSYKINNCVCRSSWFCRDLNIFHLAECAACRFSKQCRNETALRPLRNKRYTVFDISDSKHLTLCKKKNLDKLYADCCYNFKYEKSTK